MQITYQVEQPMALKTEIEPLLHEHWREVEVFQENVPLDPHWDLYQKLQDANMLFMVTARDNGTLIGYFVYFILPNLHHRSIIVAEGDIFYVNKAYRNSTIALRLLNLAEKGLKNLGATVITNKVKSTVKDAGGLFKYFGFKKIEDVYVKGLF